MKGNIMKALRILSAYFLFFFAILMLLISPVVSNSEGYVVAQVEVDTKPPMWEGGVPMCQVGDGDSGTVGFDAKLSLTRYPPRAQQVIVTFRAYTDEENDRWGASVIPPVIVLNPGQLYYEDLKVYVTAPMYEDVNEERNVRITGTWLANPGGNTGNIEESGVAVRVAPFIKYVVSSVDGGFVRVRPGGDADYQLSIYNFGNRNESFTIKTLNQGVLDTAGLSVTYVTNTIDVGPRSEGFFKIKVRGTVKVFHPWRSHMTMIGFEIQPTNPLPKIDNKVEDLTYYSQQWYIFYYEFGPSFPEPCICGIVIGIVSLIGTYYYFKRKARARKAKRILNRRQKRRERRKQALELDD
jgi:hypothetical protein